MRTAGLEFVDLRGENEVTLGEAVDLVRPDLNLRDAPAKTDVRMVTLLLREIADTVHEVERVAKVREAVGLLEMVLINDLPAFQLRREFGDFVGAERWDAATAGNALFACKFTHFVKPLRSHAFDCFLQDRDLSGVIQTVLHAAVKRYVRTGESCFRAVDDWLVQT